MADKDKIVNLEDLKVVYDNLKAEGDYLKDAFNLSTLVKISFSTDLVKGKTIGSEDGKNTTNSKRARTGILIGYGKIFAIELSNDNYEYSIVCYDENGAVSTGSGFLEYLGFKKGVQYIPKKAIKFALCFRREDNATMQDSDITAISAALNAYYSTDETLTKKGLPGDSKIIGDYFDNEIVYAGTPETWTNVWESGTINQDTGEQSATTAAIRFYSYMLVGLELKVTVPNGMKVRCARYADSSYTTFIKLTDWETGTAIYRFPGEYVRIIVAYTDDSTIAISAGENVTRTNYLPTDKSLALSNKPADAKAVGDAYADFNTFREQLLDNDSFTETKSWAITAGGIDSATGNTRPDAKRTRTYSFIPTWKQVKVTVPTGMEMIIVYYDSDVYTSYQYMTDWMSGDVRVLPKTSFCKLLFKFTNGNDISPSDFANSKIEVTHYYGSDTQQVEIEKLKGLTGFVDPGNVVQGAYSGKANISPSTKTITFENPIYVGAGSVVGIRLGKGWDYTILSGSGRNYSILARHSNKGEWTIADDYILINMTRKDPENEGEYLDTDPSDYNPYVLSIFISDKKDIDDGYVYDPPRSLGAYNCVMRARQLRSIHYRAAAVLPNQDGDIAKGRDINGLPYSSTRYENLYVPNCVSFDTFMTAAMNPKSYLYTRKSTTSDGETILGNSKAYYGTVCSTLVSHCFGLEGYIPTTHQLSYFPGLTRLEDQNCYALELGDVILNPNDHIVIVTEIARTKKGKIAYVEITEAWPPFDRSVQYTVEQMNNRFFDNPNKPNYAAYRYSGLKNVTYTPSKWVLLDDETGTPVYNKNLCPRRGDKAIWNPGEDIEIDIMDTENYTHYKLYKNDAYVTTGSISGTEIVLTGYTYGSYKLCLTDGSNDSDFVYWIIIAEPEIIVEYLGNKTVRATFSCANAEATSIAWCRANQNNLRHLYAVYDSTLLTDEEKNAGVVENTCDATDSDFNSIVNSDNGKFYIRFMWKTEYGYYSRKYVLIEGIQPVT